MPTANAPLTGATDKRYRLPGIEREGIAQLSLLETALWPLDETRRSDTEYRTTYSFGKGHDRGQILVINLSRGKLGQDNATLFGSLLLTAIEQAALSRADLSHDQRRDHSLYLDEFQTLVTPSTAIMLSESRKYGLNLVLSYQLTRQLDEGTRQAVLGNCGTFVAFRVGAEDAELLAPAFSKFPGPLTPASLMGLPNYTCYVRMLLEGGLPSAPFSLQTLPPPVVEDDRSSIVRRVSQRRFGVFNDGQSAVAPAPVDVN